MQTTQRKKHRVGSFPFTAYLSKHTAGVFLAYFVGSQSNRLGKTPSESMLSSKLSIYLQPQATSAFYVHASETQQPSKVARHPRLPGELRNLLYPCRGKKPAVDALLRTVGQRVN
jgi:hypothetical protein